MSGGLGPRLRRQVDPRQPTRRRPRGFRLGPSAASCTAIRLAALRLSFPLRTDQWCATNGVCIVEFDTGGSVMPPAPSEVALKFAAVYCPSRVSVSTAAPLLAVSVPLALAPEVSWVHDSLSCRWCRRDRAGRSRRRDGSPRWCRRTPSANRAAGCRRWRRSRCRRWRRWSPQGCAADARYRRPAHHPEQHLQAAGDGGILSGGAASGTNHGKRRGHRQGVAQRNSPLAVSRGFRETDRYPTGAAIGGVLMWGCRTSSELSYHAQPGQRPTHRE